MSSVSTNIRPLGGHIGAQIEGIDISRALSPADFEKIHDALTAYQVIFFRDQELTDAQLIAFGRRFGPLYIHPYAPNHPDHPEVVILKSMLARADVWHSDATFQEKPPLGSILFAHEVPDHGGDTMFANMYMAYETLSEPMRRYLESLNALNHPGGASYGKGKEELSDQDKAEMTSGRTAEAGTVHPMVRTHPVSGRKALFVNSAFTKKIVGVSPGESRAILDFLFEHLKQPEFTCRFPWQKGSVAFWDNRCTQHYAIADYGDATRLMHRVMVEGERPYLGELVITTK